MPQTTLERIVIGLFAGFMLEKYVVIVAYKRRSRLIHILHLSEAMRWAEH